MIILTKQNGKKLAVNKDKIVIVEPINSSLNESKIWFNSNHRNNEFVIVKEDFQTILDIIKKSNK